MVQSEPEHRAGRSVAGKTTFGTGWWRRNNSGAITMLGSNNSEAVTILGSNNSGVITILGRNNSELSA